MSKSRTLVASLLLGALALVVPAASQAAGPNARPSAQLAHFQWGG